MSFPLLSLAETQKTTVALLRGLLFYYFLLWLIFWLFEERAKFSVGETTESTPKIYLHMGYQIGLPSVFFHQVTKFRRTGVNIIRALAWSWDGQGDDEVVAYKIVWMGLECRDLTRGYYQEAIGAQLQGSKHGHWQGRCISLTYDCLIIQFFMSEATICLLEEKRKVRQNALKRKILRIRERDSSVLKGRWLIQVEALTLLLWENFGNLAEVQKGLALGPAVVYQEKELSVKVCLEKWKIRELLGVVVD